MHFKLQFKAMNFRLPLLILCVASVASCSSTSHIDEVMDIPLKSTIRPAWGTGLLRANASYMLFGASEEADRVDRLGDYYFVTWTDRHPELPARLIFQYTQAGTGSRIQERIIEYPAGRERTVRHENFSFSGAKRRAYGDILTWKLTLEVNGKAVDSQQSFLWE